ncbi:MAG: Flp family type IVb pilin [Nitrospinae bacterium]|nr:Flp family type IVb pilin [Nitrospinota bacterium]
MGTERKGDRPLLRSFWRREEGASALEYALVVSLIAAFIVITLQAFGFSVLNLFSTSVGAIKGAVN